MRECRPPLKQSFSKTVPLADVNPIPRRGGGYMPPYHSNPFLAEIHDRGGYKYTQILNFVIIEHLILVSGQKNFLRHVGGRQGQLGS